jgi:hypothetical protein
MKLRAALQPQVERQDVKQVEVLALVFVDAFHLHVEQRTGIDGDAGAREHLVGQPTFVGEFHRAPLRAEFRIIGAGFQFRELGQVAGPALAGRLGDQLAEVRIGQRHETPRGHAVGDVGELPRPQRGEVGEHGLLEQLRMQFGDAVHRVAADAGEVRHTDIARTAFIDQRQPRHPPFVPGKGGAHLVEEAGVDLVDDFQVPWQQPAEQLDRPFLQSLRQQRVIGIGKGRAGHLPGGVPFDLVLVHQQPHQLCHGDRGMGVVELDRPVLVDALRCRGAQALDAQHVLQRA